MKMVALIPARAGSKRIPGKNTTKLLGGHPLVAYAIATALESGCFHHILVCTDDAGVIDLAHEMGVDFVCRDPVADDEPDIAWVQRVFSLMPSWEAFAILRPTSPFRTAATIRRAYEQFRKSEVHSIRAVQPVKEHPGKMWQQSYPGYPIVPLIGQTWPPRAKGEQGIETREDRPWHSLPTQTLPSVYVQNASLEMAWTYVVNAFGTISGTKIAPFFTEGYEGLDLNEPEDWARAEALLASGAVELPAVRVGAQTTTADSV